MVSGNAISSEFSDDKGFFHCFAEFVKFLIQQFDGPFHIPRFAGSAPLGIGVPAVITVDADNVGKLVSVVLSGTGKGHQRGGPVRVGRTDFR